jgi:hypothetical protein
MKEYLKRKLQLVFFLFLFAGVFGLAKSSWTGDIAVRPAGDCPVDGNGSFWSCAASPNGPGARSGCPASLTRDNTYWVADGVYNRMHIAADVDGTKRIRIKKATESAHGPSEGWVSAMGDGQAVFSGADVRASDHGFDGGYVEIDGVTGSGTSGYGIVFTTTDPQADLFTVPYYYMGNGGHVILKHVELYNQSYVLDSAGGGIYVVEGGSDFTFQNLYVHDIPCNNFTFSGLSNVTVENCVIKRNHSTAVTHGQGVQAVGGTNYTFRGIGLKT